MRSEVDVRRYPNNQATAVGSDYVSEKLKLNLKISTTTNSSSSNQPNVISIGASYDLEFANKNYYNI